jgi:endonuclease-3
VSLAPIVDRLRAEYGPRRLGRRLPPLDELVLTILSQATSDVNRDRAYRALRERFPRWEDVVAAPTDEVVEAIRAGGLANQKAPRIQAILGDLAASEQGLDLGWLADVERDDALAWLTGLHGVGVKTASIVLLFSFGVPVMPVDTHVHRVATRLGLLPPGTSAARAHPILTAMTPPDEMVEAHLLLIEHGRRTCTARRPRCPDCVLLDLCPYGQGRAGAGGGCGAGAATVAKNLMLAD